MSVAFPHGFKSGARSSASAAAARLFSNFTGIANPTTMSSFSGALASSNGFIKRASGAKRNSSRIPLSAVKPQALAANNTRLLDRVYKKVVALERKTKTNRAYVDLNAIVAATVSTGWAGAHLTSISQGDDESNRTGNEVYINALELRGSIKYTSGIAPDKTSRVRMIVVRIKNALAGAPPGYAAFVSNASVDAFYERSTAGTYQVLMDRVFTIAGVNYEVGSDRHLQFKIPVRAKTTFTGTTSGDYDAGSIWVYYIGDGWTTYAPVMNLTCRTSFQV